MIIDDLYIYKKPLTYRLFLKKPNGETICSIKDYYNLEHFTSLKELDTLNFDIPYYIDGKENELVPKIYTSCQVYLQLYSEESEIMYLEHNFKVVTITNKSTEDGKIYKEINCKSIETELQNKTLKNLKGSKVIYRTQSEINSWTPTELYPTKADFIESGILNIITSIAPSWSVDESAIDSDISSLYRYFEIDSCACLDFLLTTVQQSFMCLFQFDTIHKKIGCRNITHLGVHRGLFLSDNNFIKTHTEEINEENVVTRLYFYGKDQINLRSVNPTGEEYLLDLSFYRNSNYMSKSLLDALTQYDSLIESKNTEFSTLLSQLNTYTSQLVVKKSELEILKTQLSVLEIELNELVAEKADLTAKNSQITLKKNEITSKEAEITQIQSSIDNTNSAIETLQTQILIANNFTLPQIEELDQFIRDKETTDDTILTSEELLTEAKKVIERINQPSITFDIDIIDLFSIVECQLEWGKITLGDIGTLTHTAFNTDVELRLVAYTHKINNNSLVLTFANRNNINDTNMLYDQLKNTISTTTTMDIQKYKYLDYVNSGDKSAINSYITGILDLGKQTAIAGSNQDVKIDEKGITLTNYAYPNKQVRLLSDGIFLSTDGWQSAEWALSSDGINAEKIRGILGEFCTLKADQVLLNDDGSGLNEVGVKVTQTNGDYTKLSADGLLKYINVPKYSETPTGVQHKEDFTVHNSISLLQVDGWEFSSNCGVVSNKLLMGNLTGKFNASFAKVSKYITTSNATFSFKYSNANDSKASYCVIIDNKKYELPRSEVETTFTPNLTLSEGMHSFEWCCYTEYRDTPDYMYMYIDDIIFEQNPISRTVTGFNSEGQSYNYMHYTGTASTSINRYFLTEEMIPDVWIELPEMFKNKTFNINVYLQDTGAGAFSDGVGQIKINVVPDSIDYKNARFKVSAKVQRIYLFLYVYPSTAGSFPTYQLMNQKYWQGCDFVYTVTC